MTEKSQDSGASRDFLQTLLDSIPDSILVVNPDDKIRLVNLGTLSLSGYAEEDLVGKPLRLLLSLEENMYVTRMGEKIPVSVSEGSIRRDDGELEGMVYVVRDVRPIRKLQERLMQSEKMAAVGQLAAGVSHEINNPLGVILGFAQSLVARVEPGHAMERPLKSIEREALRCKNLVQDLLTFSRTPHSDREAVDINEAVEGALSLVQAQARMQKSEVKKELAPRLPPVLGNRSYIQQVIINLAKNALDAMPKGGTVTVVTEPWKKKNERVAVCLKVIDSGTGIPPEILPRIFEPFFTTKSVGKGTGLGLSLVYEIVKRHGGDIEVRSEPGHTEFCVKLPAGIHENGQDKKP